MTVGAAFITFSDHVFVGVFALIIIIIAIIIIITSFLYQRVSVLIQRYNAVLLHDSLPSTDRTD